MEKEEAIDLGKLLRIMIEKKKVIVSIVVICTLGALVMAFVLPKTYESTTLVQTRSGNKVDVSGAATPMAMLGVGGGAASSTTNYIELMKSRAVLDPIIADLDIAVDIKEKLNAEGFAKTNLDIKNTKGTNLITITGKGGTPEEAQMISQRVVDNFLVLMTNMNQQTQSLMVKFLSDRTNNAKQEADNASQALETFSKEHKVYGPEDQAKAAITQMAAFDKAIGEFKVQQQGASAQLDSVNAQIAKQNISSKAYNVSDNSVVLQLRNQIVAKEVELVGLQQKYQEKHPSVIVAKQELAQLQDSLNDEVSSLVDAGTATMNPTQSELMKNKALATSNFAVANASEAEVEKLQDKQIGDMGQFSDNVLEYTKLERDSKMKGEIYLNLVKQCEQAKIQEAMDSMDIQIVDAADLPQKPSAPRKGLIMVLGVALGVILAFSYSLVFYRK